VAPAPTPKLFYDRDTTYECDLKKVTPQQCQSMAKEFTQKASAMLQGKRGGNGGARTRAVEERWLRNS